MEGMIWGVPHGLEIPLPGDEGRDAGVGHRGSCVVVFESGHLRWMEVLKIGGKSQCEWQIPWVFWNQRLGCCGQICEVDDQWYTVVHLMLSKGLKIFESNPLYHGKPMNRSITHEKMGSKFSHNKPSKAHLFFTHGLRSPSSSWRRIPRVWHRVCGITSNVKVCEASWRRDAMINGCLGEVFCLKSWFFTNFDIFDGFPTCFSFNQV